VIGVQKGFFRHALLLLMQVTFLNGTIFRDYAWPFGSTNLEAFCHDQLIRKILYYFILGCLVLILSYAYKIYSCNYNFKDM
jgi:hypothetical protein